MTRAAAKIVDEMRYDVGGARLPRELEVLAVEHVPVKAEAQFHAQRRRGAYFFTRENGAASAR